MIDFIEEIVNTIEDTMMDVHIFMAILYTHCYYYRFHDGGTPCVAAKVGGGEDEDEEEEEKEVRESKCRRAGERVWIVIKTLGNLTCLN